MSQRDPSPGCSSDTVQRNPRCLKEIDHDDDDTCRSRNTLHSESHMRSPAESPDPMFGSVRHNRSRNPNQYPVESTYSPGRMILTDLPDSVPPSRIHSNNHNNGHCQRSLLPADAYLQHLMNEEDNRPIRRPCNVEERYRKHIVDERSPSPTSSSDAAEVFTSPRHSRHRQHSSHRHRLANQCKENHYQSTLPPQIHQSPSGRLRQNHCHRYHEIGQPTSCSPVCDSGIKEDDGSSSAISHRERFSSCEDIHSNSNVCSTSGNPLVNHHGNMQIATITNDHHRMSSGISCESSTSSPSIRNHGIEHCVTDRHRGRHNHVIQPYALDHHQRVQIAHPAETKSPLLIGLEAIQVSFMVEDMWGRW